MRLTSKMTSILLFALFILAVVCAVDADAHSHLHKRQSQTPDRPLGTATSPTIAPSSPTAEPESTSESQPTRASASVSASSLTPASPTLPSIPSETPTVPEQTTVDTPPTPSTTEEPRVETVTTVSPAQSIDTPAPDPGLSTSVRSGIALLTTTAAQSIQSVPVVTTTIVTVSGGITMSTVVTSSVSPTEPSPTASPTLNGSSGSSSSSGITPSQKRTIIGVVVGIGGAILIGALAVVAWRIWGRKKHNAHDDMYDPNMSLKERSSTGSGSNPFKSTLDQYHNPAPVNTASNF